MLARESVIVGIAEFVCGGPAQTDPVAVERHSYGIAFDIADD